MANEKTQNDAKISRIKEKWEKDIKELMKKEGYSPGIFKRLTEKDFKKLDDIVKKYAFTDTDQKEDSDSSLSALVSGNHMGTN